MKFRSWLLMILFAHVMLHPWVHFIGDSAASQTQVSSTAASAHALSPAGDQCELCRVGHSATAVLQLPKIDLLNPHWIHVALQAVNYASLQADRRVPSRAPPLS